MMEKWCVINEKDYEMFETLRKEFGDAMAVDWFMGMVERRMIENEEAENV